MDHVSAKRHRIAELAKRSPELVITSLNHLIDIEWLLEAYSRMRKYGAVVTLRPDRRSAFELTGLGVVQ